MRLLLSRDDTKRTSDIWALGRLLDILKESKLRPKDSHFQATRKQWIDYLSRIVNQHAHSRPRDKDYVLPFEDEFLKYLEEDTIRNGTDKIS